MSRIRLICPNCGAQYEVPLEVIPEKGRDVQCSSCQHTWFQEHPDHPSQPPEAAPSGDQEPEPRHPPAAPEPAQPSAPAEGQDDGEDDISETPPAPETTRRRLAPDVADVLREERDYEARRREAEAEALETQADLGLEPPESDARERRLKEAQVTRETLRGPIDPLDGEDTGPEAASAAPAARRKRLPDVEEISQTLRSADAPRAVDMAKRRHLDDLEDTRGKPSGGFSRGFFLVVLLAAIAIAIYAFAPQITSAVPALADQIAAYVAKVDALRVWLDAQVSNILLMLDGMSSEASSTDG